MISPHILRQANTIHLMRDCHQNRVSLVRNSLSMPIRQDIFHTCLPRSTLNVQRIEPKQSSYPVYRHAILGIAFVESAYLFPHLGVQASLFNGHTIGSGCDEWDLCRSEHHLLTLSSYFYTHLMDLRPEIQASPMKELELDIHLGVVLVLEVFPLVGTSLFNSTLTRLPHP